MSQRSAAQAALRLRDVEVLDTEGTPLPLGSLWTDRPVVLVFVRHYG